MKVFLSPPHLSGKEAVYAQDALTSGWVAPAGAYLSQFERAVAHYVGTSHAVALNSGTAAMHLALKVLGIGKGDIVLCPTFTFVATANPILYEQALPVWVDSETETWNISPQYIEQAIDFCQKKYQKKPKYLVVVHLYGKSALMPEICAIAQKHQIPIIEDAAEALGTQYVGKHAGTWGEIGFFSFNGNKIITTSAGGILVSNNEDYTQKTLYLATQAKENLPYYEHKEIGYNYRMSNVLAAIGLAQMEVLEERIQQRQRNFTLYKKYLSHIPIIHFPTELPNSIDTHWLSCVLFDKPKLAEQVRTALYEQGIEARPLWKPLHLQPLLRQYDYVGTHVAEGLFHKGLCLPSGSQLSEADIAIICQIISKICA